MCRIAPTIVLSAHVESTLVNTLSTRHPEQLRVTDSGNVSVLRQCFPLIPKGINGQFQAYRYRHGIPARAALCVSYACRGSCEDLVVIK